jgi:sugar-specific transcriptional regulator TrmB
MQEDLVLKLSEFGFTINQAKVYLTIVQSGSITAGKISKITQLHRQDVYKTVAKLEEMGLVIKTIDKPALIEAIPVEKALGRLVANEKEKARKRIAYLEANMRELSNFAMSNATDDELQESVFIPLKTDDQVKNRAVLTFEEAKEECDLFLDLELISGLIEEFRDRFKTIDKEVRIRIMIKNVENDNEISNIVKKIRPEHKDFMVKIINNSESIPYYIIDQRELWIGMKNRTEVGLPCVLWTNERNIIKFFQDSFNEAWNCPKALIVFQSKT